MNVELDFPKGIRLLEGWQNNDVSTTETLKQLFCEVIDGHHDANFKQSAPQDCVHASASVNLLTLTLMFRLFGVTAESFYLDDPDRYVRTTLATRKLLGMPKMYCSWPVYAFTAQALGQVMMYPDQFPPGSDPDHVLATRENWRDIATPDLGSGIPKLLEEILASYERLTGMDPVLHLSAPYSLAADIYGQEPLIEALTNEPEFVNQFLDHLADVVLAPWITQFFDRFPNGWVELSDASGSPFFIGPNNCKSIAIRSIQRLIDNNVWGRRVYIANYRGDYVTRAGERAAPSGRRRSGAKPKSGKIGLQELSDLKQQVCRDFVIRLDDDRVELPFYVDQAIAHNVPLFVGIGAGQIDRNSLPDLQAAKQGIAATSADYVAAIKKVATTIADNGYAGREPPWPGTIYFEDISSESSFEMIEIIVGAARNGGRLA